MPIKRAVWQPTMPPSPQNLHLPSRHHGESNGIAARKGNQSTLFFQEQSFSRDRDRRKIIGEEEEVGKEEKEGEKSGMGEETWRFQAEFLRAECKFLQADRKFVAKKLEQNRALLERTLSSALQNLISGRERIMCEGKSMRAVLDGVIEDLSQKLRDVQRMNTGGGECEVRQCLNFDKQACVRQGRVQNIGGSTRCVKGVGEMSGANTSFSSAACRIDDKLLPNRISDAATERTGGGRESTCSGHCKAVVRRVVEQVRAETEHWAQMQEMLAEVRQEMEHLQASRDFWADRAQRANHHHQSRSLHSHLEKWRRKAVASESKANELQAQISDLQSELEDLSTRLTVAETKGAAAVREAQIEMEERLLIFQLKETHKERRRGQACLEKNSKEKICSGTRQSPAVAPKPSRRSPLQDIGNQQQDRETC